MMTKTLKRCAGALVMATMLVGGAVAANAGMFEDGFGGGHGWHGGQAYQQLKPEQQAKYNTIFKAFQDAMNPLAEKMMAKRIEINALRGNQNADPKRITTLAEEIASLRTQMRTERMKLDEKLRAEVGIGLPDRYDGRGHKGNNMHEGKGKHKANRDRMHNNDCNNSADCPF